MDNKITMEMMNFAKEVCELVDGKIVMTEKANGVLLIGIESNKRKGNISPRFYINDLYNKGFSVKEVANMCLKEMNTSAINIDLDFIRDFKKVKPLLRCALFNKATNKQVFVSAKGYGYSDLIICPRISIDNIDVIGSGTVYVTNQLLESWGTDAKELVRIGLENEVVSVNGIVDTLKEMNYKEADELPDLQMLVLSNDAKQLGAVSAIAYRKQLMNRFPNGYLVLPSSIHEVLIMDIKEYKPEFDSMVKEINEMQVAPEERLSDRVYLIKPRTRK